MQQVLGHGLLPVLHGETYKRCFESSFGLHAVNGEQNSTVSERELGREEGKRIKIAKPIACAFCLEL